MEFFLKPKLQTRTGSHLTTVDTYVVVPDDDTEEEYHYTRGYKNKLIELKCTVAALHFKIDVSNNLTDWHPKKAETAIAIGAFTFESMTEIWRYVRIQVKPQAAGVHGTLAVRVEMSTI